MKLRKSLLLTAILAAFVFPASSYAQDATNATKGMTGTMVHGETVVDHGPAAPKKKTRAEVKKELAAAHKNGTHDMGNDVSTVKTAPTAGKSRQAVKKELADMTPAEKKKLKEDNLGAK